MAAPAHATTLLTERLGELVAEATLDSLPAEVVEYGKQLLLDTIACTVGGSVVGARQGMMIDAVTSLGTQGKSTILVSGQRVDPVSAAMVNAEAGSVLAAHDSFYFSHTANLSFSVALALAEHTSASGADLLAAFVMGVEISSLLNIMTPAPAPPASLTAESSSDQGKLRSSARIDYVTIGGTAAAARVLNLRPEETAHALSIAAATSPSRATPPRTRMNSVNYMAYYPKAQTAIMSALLAQQGFTGFEDIFEGSLATFDSPDLLEPDREQLVADIGRRWWILDDCVKHYPACRLVAGPVELFDELREEHDLKPDEIDSVTVRLSPFSLCVGAIAEPSYEPDPASPNTPLDLIYNAPYQIAMVALGVPAGPQWYRPERFADPAVLALMRKVELEVDEEAGREIYENALRAPHHRVAESGGTGVVVSARGQTFSASSRFVKGDPWQPETKVTDGFLGEKMREYGAGFLREGAADRVVALTSEIEDLADVRELVSLLAAT